MTQTLINSIPSEVIVILYRDLSYLFLFISIGMLYLFITHKREFNKDNLREYFLYLNNKFLIFIIMINSFIVFISQFSTISYLDLLNYLVQISQNIVFYSFVTYSIIGLLYLINYISVMYVELNLFGNKLINTKSVNKKRGKK